MFLHNFLSIGHLSFVNFICSLMHDLTTLFSRDSCCVDSTYFLVFSLLLKRLKRFCFHERGKRLWALIYFEQWIRCDWVLVAGVASYFLNRLKLFFTYWSRCLGADGSCLGQHFVHLEHVNLIWVFGVQNRLQSLRSFVRGGLWLIIGDTSGSIHVALQELWGLSTGFWHCSLTFS